MLCLWVTIFYQVNSVQCFTQITLITPDIVLNCTLNLADYLHDYLVSGFMVLNSGTRCLTICVTVHHLVLLKENFNISY